MIRTDRRIVRGAPAGIPYIAACAILSRLAQYYSCGPMSPAAKRKATALAIFLSYLAVVGLGSTPTPYSKAADITLLALHLAFIAAASILLVWSRATGRHRSERETILQKYLRWMEDNYPVSK